ncbi:hypothetical protein BC567DRAFT_237427 [Phyllosticta citribraziliensis]
MWCFLHAGRLGPPRDLTVSTHTAHVPCLHQQAPRLGTDGVLLSTSETNSLRHRQARKKRWSPACKSDPHFAKSHGEPMRDRNRSRLFLRPSALTARAQARRVVRLSNLHHAPTGCQVAAQRSAGLARATQHCTVLVYGNRCDSWCRGQN